MSIECSSVCDIGLKRAINQDCILTRTRGGCGLFAVADGMGGHNHGERASAAIVESLQAWWDKLPQALPVGPLPQTVQSLEAAVAQANQSIFAQTSAEGICGSTLVLLWLQPGAYAVLSVGDSHCYWTKRQWLKKQTDLLTVDDVWRAEDGADSRKVGKLTAAIGARQGQRVNVQTGELKGTGVMALCSDGIYKHCERRVLEKILQRTASKGGTKEAVREIEAEVRRAGAPDNYSLVLVRIDGTKVC